MLALDSTVGWLHLFGEPTRVRLLHLLAQNELTVAELTAITELPQSRVSTHLGKLREAGVLRDRKVGASTFYAVNEATMPPAARALWKLLSQAAQRRRHRQRSQADAQRCCARDKATVVARRRRRPDGAALLAGRTWEAVARGFIGLLAPRRRARRRRRRRRHRAAAGAARQERSPASTAAER